MQVNRCFLVLCTTNAISKARQPLRICTQYFKMPTQNMNQIDSTMQTNFWQIEMKPQTNIRKESQKIFQMFVYTSSNVYFSVATMRNFNRDLSWNEKYQQLLRNSLSGQNSNVVIEFQITKLKLRIYSEFQENSILCLHKDPVKHSRQLSTTVNGCLKQKLIQLTTNVRMQQATIQKLDALGKQTVQQFEFDMSMAKQRFLSVINKAKQKLRPHFGFAEKKIENQDSGTQTRNFYRIKSSSLNNKQSENIYNLFD